MNQKGSATIVILIILALLIAGAGYYYYSTRQGQPAAVTPSSKDSAPSQKSAQVISPAGGEQWEAGSTHEIKWSNVTKGTRVSINYQSPFGIGRIVDTGNSGSYNWAIPSTLKPSDKYYIIITTAGKDFDVAYSAAFAIVSAAANNSSQIPTSMIPRESPQTTPNPTGGSAEVTCLTLPSDYRTDIPVFSGSCLLQIIPIEKNGVESYAVFYEAAASGADLTAFFDAALAAKGWATWAEYEKLITLPPGMTGHGFTKANYGLAVGVESSPSGKTHFYIGYNISD